MSDRERGRLLYLLWSFLTLAAIWSPVFKGELVLTGLMLLFLGMGATEVAKDEERRKKNE